MFRMYLVGSLILGTLLLAAALATALLATALHLPPKRPALAAMAAVAFVLAGRRPAGLWDHTAVRSWELLLGSRRARIGLWALGLIALLLALFAPPPWLRVLPR